MERSDLDYALSLHYLLNGESINDVIAQSNVEVIPVKQEEDDLIIEKIPVRLFKLN